jgi:hypothetical protein
MKVALVIVMVLLAACEPQDRTPGMWLSGELVESPTEDWSFTGDYNEISIQTNPWYGIPFSVTTVIATAEGNLYVPSIYDTQAGFPGSKYWNRVIQDNPEVTLKIGDKLYPRRARLVTSDEEFELAFEALAEKYDFWRTVKTNPDKRPPFVLISMGEG